MNVRSSITILTAIFLISCHSSKIASGLNSKLLQSQELSIETEDSIFISGNLEYASNEKLAIIIAGSGPTDRDCNNHLGLKTDAFKMLASYLKSQGISSFRFDKRSVGKSTFVEESDLLFDTFISDVSQLVEYFKNDFEEIILVGHSEGALIGSIASRNEHVDAFVSVSGISKSLDQVIIDQLQKYPKLVPLAKKHIEEINGGKELSDVNPILRSLFRPSVAPYLKSIFAVDPLVEISKLNKPVLILNGTCDIQVTIENAEELHKANSNSELHIIENMGHVLKELKPDCSNSMEAYSSAEMPLNDQFKKTVAQFINEYRTKK